jgi:hypothetical protein
MRRRRPVARVTLALGILAAGIAGGETPSSSCVGGQLEATVSLRYDERTLGEVAGLFLQVAYPEGVSIPGKGTDASVRERITSLLDPKFRLVGVDEDSNADGREDRLRILLVAPAGAPLPAAPIARIRFDCEGSRKADALRCTTDQVADGAGQLLREKVAKQVTCDVGVQAPSTQPAAAR